MRRLIPFLLMLLSLLVFPLRAEAQVGYSPSTLRFGGTGNWRPMPSSGTLTGTYFTDGNWVQTGPITAREVHAYFTGNVTINNAITVSPGVAFQNSDRLMDAFASSQPSIYNSGGAHAGAGGKGGRAYAPTIAYTTVPELLTQMPLYGQAASDDTSAATPGGMGGGGFYVEARGNITLTSSAAITANGTTPTGGSTVEPAGAGPGGGVDMRALGSITINSGATVTANGAAGVNGSTWGSGGGGGGFINFETLGGLTNSGTLTANGGAASNHGGLAGSVGQILAPGNFHGPRLGTF